MPRLTDRARSAVAALLTRPASVPAVAPEAGITEMLGEIGATLLASSQATSDVEDTLNDLAVQYGRHDLRIIVLPTLLLIEDVRSSTLQTAIFPARQEALRLDQSGAMEQLVREAGTHRTAPESVIDSINGIRTGKPRFGSVLSVIGYTLLTVGFGLVLNPTVTALPVYVVLGAIVGLIVLFGSRLQTLSLILPALTAFTVTILISVLVRPFVHDDVLRLVAPPLVSFLPGMTLTIAAVELTSGQMMAGASRLVYGIARLGLLAFGVFAGISAGGPPPAVSGTAEQLGAWAPWAGVLLVSIGYFFFSAAPRGSWIWILYALVVAYSAQLLGNLLVGAELSGLVGAIIVIPAVYLAGRLKAAPSTAIMLTCGFWILVPGAMGFIGLSEAASGTAGATQVILRTFASLLAIAIGMLLGAGLSRDVGAVSRGWRSGTTDDDKDDDRA